MATNPWHIKWGAGLILTYPNHWNKSSSWDDPGIVQEPHLLQTLLLALLAKLIEDIASLIRQRRKKNNTTKQHPPCLRKYPPSVYSAKFWRTLHFKESQLSWTKLACHVTQINDQTGHDWFGDVAKIILEYTQFSQISDFLRSKTFLFRGNVAFSPYRLRASCIAGCS